MVKHGLDMMECSFYFMVFPLHSTHKERSRAQGPVVRSDQQHRHYITSIKHDVDFGRSEEDTAERDLYPFLWRQPGKLLSFRVAAHWPPATVTNRIVSPHPHESFI